MVMNFSEKLLSQISGYTLLIRYETIGYQVSIQIFTINSSEPILTQALNEAQIQLTFS